MKGTRNYQGKKALLVSEDKLRYLHGFLSSKFNEVSYTAFCIDDSKLVPESFESLLEYENPSFKRITGLRVEAYSVEQGNLEIQLGVVGAFPSKDLVGFTFSYQDISWGIEIENELVERLEDFYPWYWWMKRLRLYWMLPAALVVSVTALAYVLGGIVLIQSLSGTYTSSNSSQAEDSPMILIMNFVVGSLVLVGLGLDRLSDYCFPEVFFCLGRQVEEYNRRKRVRNAIFGTLIGGIALGILTNIVSGWILK